MIKLTTEQKLTITISALKTIRQNRRKGDWEVGVIDKALDMIKNPNNYDWSHYKKTINNPQSK